ncbi:MAG: ABC transporter permease subunit [Planctomycetes bacterium]|nr:ABC transporter permease subunit [Planctomycetota bacterium]
MKKILAICRREAFAYFYGPIFYVAATFLTFMIGFTFYQIVKHGSGIDANIGYITEMGGSLLLFITPMLTMRLFAEEYKQGTMESLMTAPVTDWQVVIGKYLAVCAVTMAMFLPMLVHVGVLYALGKPAAATTLTLAAVLFVWGAFYAAVGLLVSAFTREQVVAAVLGLAANVVLWIVGFWLGQTDFVKRVEWLDKAVSYVGFYTHLEPALRGVVDTRDIVYFAGAIVFLLFATVRVLESRKWRG